MKEAPAGNSTDSSHYSTHSISRKEVTFIERYFNRGRVKDAYCICRSAFAQRI